MIRRMLTLGFVSLLALPLLVAHAASPLNFILADGETYRHVLETGDWLVLARLYVIPTTQTAYSDSFSVPTTDGDFDDPIVLTNRVHETGSTDFLVKADDTTITTYCELQQDNQTINCEDTGLANATYTVVVTYRSGWSAYSNTDVMVRLKDAGVVVAERVAGRIGYGLIGIYLTAADVTALELGWEDAGITLEAIASPALWVSPSSDTSPIATWHGESTRAATAAALTTRLRVLLTTLEMSDDTVGTGDYVQPEYITNAGTIVAIEAFSLIRSVTPQAFASSRINPFPTAIATPSKSMVTAVETATAGTSVFTSMQAVHPMAGLVVTLIGSVVLSGLLFVSTHSSYIAVAGWFAAMLSGWMVFGVPYTVIFIPAAGLAALGFLFIARKVFD